MDEIERFFAERIPQDWFTGDVDVSVDREEIVVVGTLAPPESEDPAASRAEAARIGAFREETRGQRMRIAAEAEELFLRKVAWGARCGDTAQVFTNASVPVMTRLRQPERLVLDTLVEAGVARSRSDALAWAVRLVGTHEGDWIAELREALVEVQRVRAAGPAA